VSQEIVVPHTTHTEPHSDRGQLDLPSQIEALLFVADEPVSVQQLAQALEVSPSQVEVALQELAARYERRGLRLQCRDHLVQFVTAPEAADQVRRFLGLDVETKLSPAALEALALVAYRQPVTRVEIDAVRGVNSDSVLRTLLSRGLICALGRLDRVGRPIVYGTTFEFLQHFGLSDLSELPALEEVKPAAEGGQ
jgi:segregation and condensation protein B